MRFLQPLLSLYRFLTDCTDYSFVMDIPKKQGSKKIPFFRVDIFKDRGVFADKRQITEKNKKTIQKEFRILCYTVNRGVDYEDSIDRR